MTVKEIVTAKLRELGADGLCNEECGCGLDDQYPCDDGPSPDCEAAVRRLCDDPESDRYGEMIYLPLGEEVIHEARTVSRPAIAPQARRNEQNRLADYKDVASAE